MDVTTLAMVNSQLTKIADFYEWVYQETTDATPTTVFTYTFPAAENVRIYVVCNATLGIVASYNGVKSRTFFFDGTTLTNGTLRTHEADEYLGTGLSTATFTITNSGTDIIVQWTGEASDTIQASFKVLIQKVICIAP